MRYVVTYTGEIEAISEEEAVQTAQEMAAQSCFADWTIEEAGGEPQLYIYFVESCGVRGVDCDDTNDNEYRPCNHAGWYWSAYGPQNGPFQTEQEARENAEGVTS